MASVTKSVLMEYLQCTLCLEDMQRSCILQCHHSFCVDCLQKYMAQATDTQKITCPICRKVTTLPDGDLTTLPPNFLIDNLKNLITKETDDDIDMIEKDKVSSSADREVVVCSLEDCQGEAVMYCTVDQEYLCQTCADEHAVGRFSKKHETVCIEEANVKKPTTEKSHHPCGLHPNQLLDMYCKTCDEIICYACMKRDHGDHHITSLLPFVKPCEDKLDAIMKRIDKLLKCVHLAKQTSQQQIDKAQHHIVCLKTQVTSTLTQIREKLAQQEEGLMSDLEKAATRVDKVASSTLDEQQLIEVTLESLRFLCQRLTTDGDVYDQMSNLPSLEEAVEKRRKTEVPGVMWIDKANQDNNEITMSGVDQLTLTETSHIASVLPCLEGDSTRVTVSSEHDVTTESNEEAEQQIAERGRVCATLVHKNVLCFVKLYEPFLYMYSDRGDLIGKHRIPGMNWPRYLMLVTKHDDVKLIITAEQPPHLYYMSVHSADDKFAISNEFSKKLD